MALFSNLFSGATTGNFLSNVLSPIVGAVGGVLGATNQVVGTVANSPAGAAIGAAVGAGINSSGFGGLMPTTNNPATRSGPGWTMPASWFMSQIFQTDANGRYIVLSGKRQVRWMNVFLWTCGGLLVLWTIKRLVTGKWRFK